MVTSYVRNQMQRYLRAVVTEDMILYNRIYKYYLSMFAASIVNVSQFTIDYSRFNIC